MTNRPSLRRAFRHATICASLRSAIESSSLAVATPRLVHALVHVHRSGTRRDENDEQGRGDEGHRQRCARRLRGSRRIGPPPIEEQSQVQQDEASRRHHGHGPRPLRGEGDDHAGQAEAGEGNAEGGGGRSDSARPRSFEGPASMDTAVRMNARPLEGAIRPISRGPARSKIRATAIHQAERPARSWRGSGARWRLRNRPPPARHAATAHDPDSCGTWRAPRRGG